MAALMPIEVAMAIELIAPVMVMYMVMSFAIEMTQIKTCSVPVAVVS